MSETSPPIVSVENCENGIIVRLTVKMLDDKEVKEVGRAVDEASQKPGVSVVTVDMSRVHVVPSMALGGLVQLANKCRSRNQTLKLAALTPMVRQVFRITRLDRVIELADSVP